MSGTIIFAAGEGWEKGMPAEIWDAMTVSERTQCVVGAWLEHEARPGMPEREKLLKNINDPELAEGIWDCWLSLPESERQVLRAINTHFLQADLSNDGIWGAALASPYDKNKSRVFWNSCPIIYLDPALTEDPMKLRATIFHEMAHAALRHSETMMELSGFEIDHARWLLERAAIRLGKQWAME